MKVIVVKGRESQSLDVGGQDCMTGAFLQFDATTWQTASDVEPSGAV